jgi:hypothetical protein
MHIFDLLYIDASCVFHLYVSDYKTFVGFAFFFSETTNGMDEMDRTNLCGFCFFFRKNLIVFFLKFKKKSNSWIAVPL